MSFLSSNPIMNLSVYLVANHISSFGDIFWQNLIKSKFFEVQDHLYRRVGRIMFYFFNETVFNFIQKCFLHFIFLMHNNFATKKSLQCLWKIGSFWINISRPKRLYFWFSFRYLQGDSLWKDVHRKRDERLFWNLGY